ncbi:unnamed protein product [Angiostrongylus costaricensis]|uniref:BED-type domain-containing protein n=1 Tax=Angiostrongylus costaricensis TaxID=334426 RepID=A0A0R3PCX9_ANGCS|nr:unnamed protein product [Angiostrongylus costaricensis]
MFYYAATATSAGTSLVSQDDPPQFSVPNALRRNSRNGDFTLLKEEIAKLCEVEKSMPPYDEDETELSLVFSWHFNTVTVIYRITRAVLPVQLKVHEKDGLTSQKIRKCSTKRGRPTKNPVWTFFRRIDDRSVQCNMCARLVKSACATNMSKHLERHHQASATKLMPDSIDVEFEVNHMTVVDNSYTQSLPSPWNPYVQQHMQPIKHVVVHFFR